MSKELIGFTYPCPYCNKETDVFSLVPANNNSVSLVENIEGVKCFCEHCKRKFVLAKVLCVQVEWEEDEDHEC